MVSSLRGEGVRGPREEMVCIGVGGVGEACRGGGCVGDDRGILGGAEHGELASEAIDLQIVSFCTPSNEDRWEV